MIFRLSVLLEILLIAGCQGGLSGMQPYGEVVFDGEDPYEQGITLVLPNNAPSIIQRYVPEEWSMEMLESRPFYIHDGIDIAGEKGAPVLAGASGTVQFSRFSILWGNEIGIDHGKNVDGVSYLTRYVHLSARMVATGDVVQRGQAIGALGGTGLLGALPHLHFSLFQQDLDGALIAQNPNRFWSMGEGIITCFDSKTQETKQTNGQRLKQSLKKSSKPSFSLSYPAECLESPEM